MKTIFLYHTVLYMLVGLYKCMTTSMCKCISVKWNTRWFSWCNASGFSEYYIWLMFKVSLTKTFYQETTEWYAWCPWLSWSCISGRVSLMTSHTLGSACLYLFVLLLSPMARFYWLPEHFDNMLKIYIIQKPKCSSLPFHPNNAVDNGV